MVGVRVPHIRHLHRMTHQRGVEAGRRPRLRSVRPSQVPSCALAARSAWSRAARPGPRGTGGSAERRRPAAVVAFGAMAALEESGLRIPEDLSVIGCDDISVDDLPSSRRLTTATMARDELGRQAARRLESLMAADGDTEPRSIPMELRVRLTSAPPAASPG
ncbi:substrate-binding domain-containing protein [Streptomyces sp. NPDC059426]|uniref:substrate-binding domain-containing protein n=1 Tax=Streptomyces sp. NPDC059426 TaxID=3346827 RepID=UPI00369CAB7C